MSNDANGVGMKNIFLIVLTLFLMGCATAITYSPYTSQKFPPKPKDYFITIYPQAQQRPIMAHTYVIIGKVNISGKVSNGVTSETLLEQAKAIARKKGADAIINAKTEKLNYNAIHTVPSEVTYHPVVIAGGRHNGGTVYMEDYRPAEYIPYTETLFTFNGELVIFKE
jgi:hypothetical protein